MEKKNFKIRITCKSVFNVYVLAANEEEAKNRALDWVRSGSSQDAESNTMSVDRLTYSHNTMNS